MFACKGNREAFQGTGSLEHRLAYLIRHLIWVNAVLPCDLHIAKQLPQMHDVTPGIVIIKKDGRKNNEPVQESRQKEIHHSWWKTLKCFLL